MRKLVQAAALLAATAAASSATAEPGPRRLGLVVSGGVSEGAYQAGATYALLRHYLARRERGLDLEVASGASAGNINVVLASTFWLSADTLSCESAMGNIFHDTWVNVGWDRLAPVANDWGRYAPLFLPDQVGADRKPEDAVYTGEDGIVTRSALAAVLENAKRRMRGRWRKGARIDLGITMTGEALAPLPLHRRQVDYCPPLGASPAAIEPATLQVQRYVVPFTFEAPATDAEADIGIKSVRKDWPSDHGRIGHVLPLAAPEATIEVDLLLHAVMAAKGFPIAFGPKALGGFCPNPKGLRFWDGGLFDNVPVSLLFELNHERSRDRATAPKPDPIEMLYVDAALVRPETRDGEAPVKRGLGLLMDIFAQRLTEARQFELQAIPRFNPDELSGTAIQMPDRFFPLTAHKLPSAFGAFLHEAFRRHDYLVGLYDGVFALARARPEVPALVNAEGWSKLVAAFEAVLGEITAAPPGPATCRPQRGDARAGAALARSFLRHLLAAELRMRAPSAVIRGYERQLGKDTARVHPDDDVWKVFDSIYEAARHREGLVAAGDPARLAAFDADEGSLQGFLRRLPPHLTVFSRDQDADPKHDPEGFLAESGDRLLRRALDIEKADQALLVPDERGPSQSMEWLLTWGRIGLASALERSPRVFDIDSSSVRRLAGASPWPVRWFGYLVPHYLASHITACRHEIGWHPRLRSPWGWGEDGRHWSAGFFLASNLSLQKRFLCSAPDRDLRLQPAGGLGFDPAGRLLDDLQALATFTRSGGRFDRAGFELGITVATKVRLALGVDDLFWRRDGGRWGRGWGRLHVSLGVADLNGLLYWLVQSWFDPQYGREAKLAEELAGAGTPGAAR